MTGTAPLSRGTLRGLDALNFFLADVQSGVGPFLAIYLAAAGWQEQTVGVVLTGGGIAQILAQTPAGALADRIRSKRALLGAGVVSLAIGALSIAFFPAFWPVLGAQVLIGISSSVFGPTICAVSLGLVGRSRYRRPDQGISGRFNLTLGLVTTAVGIGAALSQSMARAIVQHVGYHAGFLFLAAVAATALVLLWVAMPETGVRLRLQTLPAT